MGTFREKVTLSHPQDPNRNVSADCVVDTGATYTWVPASLLEKIGVTPQFKRKFKIADGRIVERELCVAFLTMEDTTLPTLVVFGDEGSDPLLGAVTLEEFGLGVDPVSKVLVPVPALLLGFLKE